MRLPVCKTNVTSIKLNTLPSNGIGVPSGSVPIHTHKFVDQNGREFDIADYYAILLLHILFYLVKLFLSISANFFQFI